LGGPKEAASAPEWDLSDVKLNFLNAFGGYGCALSYSNLRRVSGFIHQGMLVVLLLCADSKFDGIGRECARLDRDTDDGHPTSLLEQPINGPVFNEGSPVPAGSTESQVLSATTIIGVGLGIIAALLIAMLIAVFFLLKRRQRQERRQREEAARAQSHKRPTDDVMRAPSLNFRTQEKPTQEMFEVVP
jgi:hypothetical protein